MRESHAQRTAQRQIQFQQKIQQDAQKHQADIAATDLETAAEIQRQTMRSLSEDQGEE
jgi:protein-arginine kinase activator protein McsA